MAVSRAKSLRSLLPCSVACVAYARGSEPAERSAGAHDARRLPRTMDSIKVAKNDYFNILFIYFDLAHASVSRLPIMQISTGNAELRDITKMERIGAVFLLSFAIEH